MMSRASRAGEPTPGLLSPEACKYDITQLTVKTILKLDFTGSNFLRILDDHSSSSSPSPITASCSFRSKMALF